MRITEPIETKGHFWLPSDSSNRFPGVLSISESGRITVEIQGDLPGAFDHGAVRLLGEVNKLGGITLEHCTLLSYRINNTIEYTLDARFALCGVLYEENESATFCRVSFSIDGLSEWLSISGFTLDRSSFSNDKSLTLTYQHPAPIDLRLSEDISIRFAFSFRGPTVRRTMTNVHIEQTAHVSLESSEPLHVEDIMSLTVTIRNFFCFAIGEAVSIHSVFVATDDIRREVGDGPTQRLPIKLYCESLYHSEKVPQVYEDRMLFRYAEVKSDIASIIARWFESYEAFKPTLDLYFASRLDRHANLEVRFQWLTQALEALHRGMSAETLKCRDAFEELCLSIIVNCPEDKRDWLERTLRYANELSLTQRIKRLMAPFKEYFGSSKEREGFVHKVVITRNSMAHRDVSLSEDAANGQELLELSDKLDGLLQLNVLKIIGFSEDAIRSASQENGPLRRLLGLARSP